MNKIRLIQCGVGGFGETWIKDHTSSSPDFELVAIVDVSAVQLEKAGSQYGISADRRFTSLEAALEKVTADAVLTVTPPPVHVIHARLAFAAGLHFMTEKPLADTIGRARKMIEMAAQANRQLVVSQQYRYDASIQKVRALIQREVVGPLGHGHLDFYIAGDFAETFRGTMDYPLLLDMSIHHMDLIRCITGRDVTKVTAHSFRPAWSQYRHDPGLKMNLELEGGLPFSYSGDWSACGRATSWHGTWRLQCAQGSIHLAGDKVEVVRSGPWGKDASVEEISVSPLARTGQAQTLHSFAQAIRTGLPAETSGANNLGSISIVLAAMKSILEKRTVALDELLPSLGREET